MTHKRKRPVGTMEFKSIIAKHVASLDSELKGEARVMIVEKLNEAIAALHEASQDLIDIGDTRAAKECQGHILRIAHTRTRQNQKKLNGF